jgi:ankyrin repeat protein
MCAGSDSNVSDRDDCQPAVDKRCRSLLLCSAALLAGGANPNQPNKDVTSALHATAQRGPLRLLQLLLEHKADVQAADAQGVTPLHLAARSGNAQKVQCLLAAGAAHGAANSQGNTPLHLVSWLS